MFSGLIAYRGTVVSNEDAAGGKRLVIEAREAAREGVEPKDSVAIDGVCLTATRVRKNRMAFDVVPETLARSTLGLRRPGDFVNVELSLRLGDRIGGHLVYGHVDAMTDVVDRAPEGQGERLTVSTPPAMSRYIVEKGYVALDGVSLTVASVETTTFSIALIPETAERTTLGRKLPGDRLNVEIDPLARYALGAKQVGN
ncbi:MAG: riboflavin synthase [Candidatus Eremiobacteraeota bacterium]|nr:riboflavin synthase [Candidatus Eremiobacteraeota bacterium]